MGLPAITLEIANVIQMMFVQRATKQNMLGKVKAFSTAIATICVPVGKRLYGYLVERFTGHMGGIVFLSGVFTFGVSLFVRWNVRQIK